MNRLGTLDEWIKAHRKRGQIEDTPLGKAGGGGGGDEHFTTLCIFSQTSGEIKFYFKQARNWSYRFSTEFIKITGRAPVGFLLADS